MSKTPSTDAILQDITGIPIEEQVWRLVEHARNLEEKITELQYKEKLRADDGK